MSEAREVIAEALYRTLLSADRPTWPSLDEDTAFEFFEDADSILSALKEAGLVVVPKELVELNEQMIELINP